jgi:hypothetical protein
VKFIEVDIHLMLSFKMGRYYLEGYQWLMVPSSEIAPRQDSPRGPLCRIAKIMCGTYSKNGFDENRKGKI